MAINDDVISAFMKLSTDRQVGCLLAASVDSVVAERLLGHIAGRDGQMYQVLTERLNGRDVPVRALRRSA